MMEEDSIKERLAELMELEESCFLSNYHVIVMKQWQKDWHEWHIKHKQVNQGDQV